MKIEGFFSLEGPLGPFEVDFTKRVVPEIISKLANLLDLASLFSARIRYRYDGSVYFHTATRSAIFEDWIGLPSQTILLVIETPEPLSWPRSWFKSEEWSGYGGHLVTLWHYKRNPVISSPSLSISPSMYTIMLGEIEVVLLADKHDTEIRAWITKVLAQSNS